MIEMLRRLMRPEKSSGEIAKNRLKVVIMQDRTTFTPYLMESLKSDLIEVFTRYLEIDESGLEFNIDKEDENIGLSISIPIKKVKPERDVGREK